MSPWCNVPGCRISSKKSKLFLAPYTTKHRWDEWKKKCPWLSLIKPMQLQNVRFCALHFNPKYITDQNRLTKDAVPDRMLPSLEALFLKFGKDLEYIVSKRNKNLAGKRENNTAEGHVAPVTCDKEASKTVPYLISKTIGPQIGKAIPKKNKSTGPQFAVQHTPNKKAQSTCKNKPCFKKPLPLVTLPSKNKNSNNNSYNNAPMVTPKSYPTIMIAPLTADSAEIPPELAPCVEYPEPESPDIIPSDTIVLDDLPDMFDMDIEDNDPQLKKTLDYCRCCLNKDHLSELWCDYLSDGERFNYGMMLNDVFGLSITYDKLDQICWSCADRLKDASLFKKVVVAADDVLNKQELSDKKSNPSQGIESIFLNENNENQDDGNTSVATEDTVDRDVEDLNKSIDDGNTSVTTEATEDRGMDDCLNESIEQDNIQNLRKRPAEAETDDDTSPKRTINLSSLVDINPIQAAATDSVTISKNVEGPRIIQNVCINPIGTRNPANIVILPEARDARSKNDQKPEIMLQASNNHPLDRRKPNMLIVPELKVARPDNTQQPMRTVLQALNMQQELNMTNTITTPELNVARSENSLQSMRTVLLASNMQHLNPNTANTILMPDNRVARSGNSLESKNPDYPIIIPGLSIARPRLEHQKTGMVLQATKIQYSENMNAAIPVTLPELKVIRKEKPRDTKMVSQSSNMPLEPKNTVTALEKYTSCKNPLQTPKMVWQGKPTESKHAAKTLIIPELSVARSENVEGSEMPNIANTLLGPEISVTRIKVTPKLVSQDNIQCKNKASIAISPEKDTRSKNPFKVPRLVLQDLNMKPVKTIAKTIFTSETRVATSKNPPPMPKIVLQASKMKPLEPRNIPQAVIDPEKDTSLKNPLQIPRVTLQDLNIKKSFHSKVISELKVAICKNVEGEEEVWQASKTPELQVASSKNVEGTEIALQDLLQKSSDPKNPANTIIIPEPRVASSKKEGQGIVLQAPNMQPLCCVETIVTCSSCHNQFTDIFTLQLHMTKCLKINK